MSKNHSSSRSFIFSALRDVWPVWIVLAGLTTLPCVVAALRAPEGFVFTGVLSAYDDTFTYFAWMRQGADGHLLMCDLFTTEPHSCEFFLPIWSVLGFIVRVTSIPIAVMFHAARLLAGLLLLLAARAVVASVMKSRARVRFTVLLYAMSAGFGWLVYLVSRGDSPLSGSADLNMPEALAFRSVFAQVHFAVGAALVFGSIKLLFDELMETNPRQSFLSGALVSLLAVVHPYMVVVVCAVAGAAVLTSPSLTSRSNAQQISYRWALRVGALFALSAIPGIAYLVYLNRLNDV